MFLVVLTASLAGLLFSAGFLLLLYWYFDVDPDWGPITGVLIVEAVLFGLATVSAYAPRPRGNGEGGNPRADAHPSSP
jgi:hypothetical protein